MPTFEHGVAVLDFGCASGRVLRHFLCQSRQRNSGAAISIWSIYAGV
ncbi:MAG: hypothetical protein R2867_19360 [Caldilineaceae bacterium]